MANATHFQQVPKYLADFVTAAASAGTSGRPLKSCRDLRSGSKITQEQYLLFRIIYATPTRTFDPLPFGLANYVQQARVIMAGPDFQNYLVAVRSNHPPLASLPAWTQNEKLKIAFRQQQEIVHGRPDGSAPVEVVVNGFLISFLKSIAELVPDANRNREWTADALRLTPSWGRVRNGDERTYTAITDGQLRYTNGDICALVECKRKQLHKHSPQAQIPRMVIPPIPTS